MWIEQRLLSLLVFIGFHRADGLRQRQLQSAHGSRGYAPQYEYYHPQDAGDPRLLSDGSDDSDSRRFLLLSHDSEPDSDKYKLSELAFMGLGPNAFLKTEKDEDTNSQTVSGGLEYFGMPLGQVSSTKTTEEEEDGSTVDTQKLENSYDFFGIPLGKISYTNKKKTNVYGEELPNSDQKAQFELFGMPMGEIPLSTQEEDDDEDEDDEKDDDQQNIALAYHTTTNEDVPQYEYSQNDFAVKPVLVPVGYGTGYHEVVYPPSRPVTEQEYSQHVAVVKPAHQVSMGTVQGYEGGYYQQVPHPPQKRYFVPSGKVGSGYERGYYRQLSHHSRQPRLVPIGTVESYEGGVYRQVIRPSSRSLEENVDSNRQQGIKPRHPRREQLAMDHQNSRRFFLSGDSGVGKKFVEPIVKLFTGGMIGNGSNKSKRKRPKKNGRRPRKEAEKVPFKGPVVVG